MLQRLFRARRARFLLREALLIVFEKRIDPRTGAEFYYNRRTGQSQWEAPVLVKALVRSTGSCGLLMMLCWWCPGGYLEQGENFGADAFAFACRQIKDGDISKPILTPRSSAIRIQAVFRKSRVRAHMKELVESVWDRMYDPHSGHCYYMNKVTGEARWNKPVLLGGEDIECVRIDSPVFVESDTLFKTCRFETDSTLKSSCELRVTSFSLSRFLAFSGTNHNVALGSKSTCPRSRRLFHSCGMKKHWWRPSSYLENLFDSCACHCKRCALNPQPLLQETWEKSLRVVQSSTASLS